MFFRKKDSNEKSVDNILIYRGHYNNWKKEKEKETRPLGQEPIIIFAAFRRL